MRSDTPTLTAVAHDIASLHNVGAIYRTADGAGCARVIVSGITGAPPDPRIAKVALGAEAALATERTATLDDLLARLTPATLVVLAEQDPRSVSPGSLDLTAVASTVTEVAVVVCDELHGAPRALRERADIVVELPMAGMKESLNVSVAFGIVMYAVADAVRRACGSPDDAQLRSRSAARSVRAGVLTRGRTRGEQPSADAD